MHTIEHTYIRLLADIGLLSGVSSIRASAYEGLEWTVNTAPLLERELLAFVERGEEFSSLWPAWLVPLRDRFRKGLDPWDLRLLRQLLLFCYKAEHRHTDETETKALKDWEATNADVGNWSQRLSVAEPRLLHLAYRACTSVLGSTKWDEIIPFHGPGAVYDKSVPKGDWSRWFETIEARFPYGRYFDIGNNRCIDGGMPSIQSTITARLVPVPKDARGPRLICVHPTEAIWIQEGLRVRLERTINRRRDQRFKWVWPRGHIHFDDQTVNASLALAASATGQYATLDLKEASDRLSDVLVQYLFGRHYPWFGCCRASNVEIRGNSTPLHCYAPMGNATTFPVQSLVFWSICVAAMQDLGFINPGDLYVFGDDIIVPTSVAPRVIEALEEFGLVVNRQKSFYRGAFRESCGMDAFAGMCVTPIRWKTTYSVASPAGLQSLSQIAQRLRQAGYELAAKECYHSMSATLRKWGLRLSLTSNPEHAGIAEYSENLPYVWRDAYWHRATQQFVSPVLRLEPHFRSECHGWYHVLSSLTRLERRDKNYPNNHPGRSDDPARTLLRGARLKRGWSRIP